MVKGENGKGGEAEGGAPYGGGGGNAIGQLSCYSGRRKKGAYKDWRKEVKAFVLGFRVAEDQVGPRVWLRLNGEANDARES